MIDITGLVPNKSNRIVLFILAFFSFAPSVFSFLDTFGFHWTIYRTIILLLLIIWFCFRWNANILINKKSISYKWFILLIIWIVWFFIGVLLSKYRDNHNAFLELLSLVNGLFLFVLFSFYSLSVTQKQIIGIFNTILVCFVLLGLFEIVSGWHFSFSMLADHNNLKEIGLSTHLATGLMYNVNDYSTCISCLVPFTLKQKNRLFTLIITICVIAINYLNDANICNLGILFGFLFYFFRYTIKEKKIKILFTIVLAMLSLVLYGLIVFYPRLFLLIPLLSTLSRQINNAKNGMGSLFKRLTIYKDTIHAVFPRHIWGYGPASFPVYFSKHRSASYLVNPHGFIFEILFEYGIGILIGFIYCLVSLCNKAKQRSHSRNQDKKINSIIVMELIILFVFCSFSPSTFIRYQYYWCVISAACILVDDPMEVRHK